MDKLRVLVNKYQEQLIVIIQVALCLFFAGKIIDKEAAANEKLRKLKAKHKQKVLKQKNKVKLAKLKVKEKRWKDEYTQRRKGEQRFWKQNPA